MHFDEMVCRYRQLLVDIDPAIERTTRDGFPIEADSAAVPGKRVCARLKLPPVPEEFRDDPDAVKACLAAVREHVVARTSSINGDNWASGGTGSLRLTRAYLSHST